MPPPPQKGGPNVAMIVLIVVVAVVVLGGGSCAMCLCIGARSASKAIPVADPPATPARPTKSTPAVKENWITAEHPYVKFLAPAGWSTEITLDKEWGIFKSPARDAVFAFTTFSRPGESTVRLGKAANVLGVSDIDWRTPRYGTVGKDRFNAHIGDGTCNFKGPGGYIWYATVNSGIDDHQILLIFTTTASAPKARRDEAQAAIDSLQKR